MFSQIQSGEKAALNLILKADVQGSLEAVTESLRRLERDEVEDQRSSTVPSAASPRTTSRSPRRRTPRSSASTSVLTARPASWPNAEDVEIRTYEIIYKLLEDIEQAMIGMLEPEYEEQVTGEAEVREIFRVPKIGAIAGCLRAFAASSPAGRRSASSATARSSGRATITSLKRFKDDAREVREGFECGIGLSDFQDLKPGDLIETFEDVEIART